MESGEEVKRYSSFASFSSQNNTFEQELVEMEYQFDFDPSLSKDGPASAALKASRKRPRSSQSPPDQHQSPSFRSSKMQLDSDSEDEVPLSRSPTPPKRSFLPNPNAYSSSNPAGSKRSEYSKASLDTPLSVDNLGYAMLMKMGWNGQQGLGKDGKGRLAPVEMKESGGSEGRGLGKLNQDVAHILESTSARRELQSEKQSREGQEEKLEREKAAAAKATLKAEVNNILLTYKCELCNKQYSKTSELEEHLNSYDHHHKKRLKELAETSRAQARARAGPNAAEKRREKERKKEEEALRKASLAAGVVLQPSTAVIGDISKSSSSSTIGGTGGFKPITNPSGGGGWKSVGSSSNTPSTSSTTSSGGGWNSTFSSSTTQSIAPNAKESLSSFFGKGHTVNLDTSSSSPNPPSISGFKPISSGFKSVSSATQGFNGFRPLSAPPPPPFDNLPPPPPPDDLPPPPPPPPM